MDIKVLRPSRMPAGMVERWRALQKSNPALESPFLTPEWALAVERSLAGRGGEINVAVALEAGVPQAFLAARVGSFTAMGAGAPMCDYEAVIAAPGAAIDPRLLVQALGVDRFDFAHAPFELKAFAPHAQGLSLSWIVDVSAGYEAYVAERRAAGVLLFKDAEKKRRRLAREGAEARFTALSSDAADFERLFAWKQAQLRSTRQVDIFAAWPMRLMRDLFNQPHGHLNGALFTLHIGGRLAAAHFHLISGRIMHAWVIAHDRAFDRWSPGILLFREILAWTAANGPARMDLGAGDYRFKRQLANDHRVLMHGFIGAPSTASLIRGAAYGVRRAAETLPLGPISTLPGKAMRRLDVLRALR